MSTIEAGAEIRGDDLIRFCRRIGLAEAVRVTWSIDDLQKANPEGFTAPEGHTLDGTRFWDADEQEHHIALDPTIDERSPVRYINFVLLHELAHCVQAERYENEELWGEEYRSNLEHYEAEADAMAKKWARKNKLYR